jgi:hypothetical protein
MKLISLVLIIGCCIQTFGQSFTFKNGGYSKCEYLRKNKPDFEAGFYFKKKNHSVIPELYDASSSNPRLKTKKINRKIWAISDNGILYLNSYAFRERGGFIKIEKLGRLLYFRAKPVNQIKKDNLISELGDFFKVPELIIIGEIISAKTDGNNNYFVELKTGQINLLTMENMSRVLRFNPKLYLDFMHEADKESMETLLKYIDLANQIPD